MEDEKKQQQQQQQHKEDKQQNRQQEEEEKQQQHHQKHQEAEEEKQQQQQQQQQHQEHQEQLNHQEEAKHQQKEKPEEQKQEKEEEEETENKQNHAVSQIPLSKSSTPPPGTIPKDQSPTSDHSHIDSPSSDNSSLSHGFSPQSPASHQPSSDPNSKPPAVTVSRFEFTPRDQSTANAVELEEQIQKLGGSGSGKRLRPDLFILRRTKRDKMVRKALLGFRISGFVFCLVSFSVLVADKNKGWALDSFDRYKEFRYCMSMNVIGFVYSGIQAYDLAYQMTSGKQKPRSYIRCFLDFVLDQILAYLLISASSSAAVRVDDWEANWGKDKFPDMARASMALSLLAFIALALSSLVSGYTLSTFKSM